MNRQKTKQEACKQWVNIFDVKVSTLGYYQKRKGYIIHNQAKGKEQSHKDCQ